MLSDISDKRCPSLTTIRFGIRDGSKSCSKAVLAGILVSIRCSPGAMRCDLGSATATLKNAVEDLTTDSNSSFLPISDPLSPDKISTMTSSPADPASKSGAL